MELFIELGPILLNISIYLWLVIIIIMILNIIKKYVIQKHNFISKYLILFLHKYKILTAVWIKTEDKLILTFRSNKLKPDETNFSWCYYYPFSNETYKKVFLFNNGKCFSILIKDRNGYWKDHNSIHSKIMEV